MFQGVHETICYGPGDKPWAEGEPRINQIVFIGRGLNRKSLMMGFKCAAAAGPGLGVRVAQGLGFRVSLTGPGRVPQGLCFDGSRNFSKRTPGDPSVAAY